MLNTYKAILNGDKIEWSDEAPGEVVAGRPVFVHVTILDQASLQSQRQERGLQMAAALERLAGKNGLADITEPLAWQNEMRQDRDLPGRDQ